MRLDVVYSTDDNYARHAGVSILSLVENNSEFDEITIYIIDNNISEENRAKLSTIISGYDRTVVFLKADVLCKELKTTDDFPVSGYARLFISQLEKVDKILYIDCDTIINGSLEELWNINVSDYMVAGVQDNPAKYMVSIVGMDDNDRYINTGVLLINLNKWRETRIEESVLSMIDKFDGSVPHHDQGIINGICKGELLIIDPKYNMMPQFIQHSSNQIKSLFNIKDYYTQDELDRAKSNPVIIHFISKFYNRPWFMDCTHPYKKLYLKYLDKSPFSKELLEPKVNRKRAARRFIFTKSPFLIFFVIEKILDIKRKSYLKKKYSKNAYGLFNDSKRS